MIFAVIDTNVIVSALMAKDIQISNPYKVVSFALTGVIIPILSPDILNEYQDVLLRSKFKFDPNKVQTLIEELINCGIVVEPLRSYTRIIDVDDQCFYDAYEYCEDRDPYLITGNKRHFPNGDTIVSASEICGMLQ